MAAFNFDSAAIRISYVTGVDEQGKSVITSKTYRNVRNNVEASEILTVVQAISSLTSHNFLLAEKILTETVDA
ncbi:DUF1659 domain-containing protein [Ureibacillus aquaedulcis]|uniref:DUF1659 domain-containing protein n=1 Tax=Ureibacillus aquaedulcis TaxID=3058421 RepID=A0ABT8GM17_9BACL|nr:DUF1659 domain-containing protein [Ureibacillus sp. BA0131]MDN4492452.1 DUF1659 domain-containing protein [Ureibacillus sp. BA0131]